ncbi:ectomycorrhiza-regulated CFEM domain-containing [Pyrrhoderma noxium]|uniref:Ectomycorrhiza-regulated CFEM domain-containing n=1 Tax=Pyrrhoderma noxium TaxID=2282107 RepID=A0A286UKK9_9AGAM|nr:ectomycorrhiza-regulated CFEM domain-containing [Pyrrhoderma noxium]
MFSKTAAKLILAATLGAVFVAAQSSTDTASAASPSGTGSIDACILTCVTQAASSAGCSSFQDLQCVCTNTDFQSAAQQCLQSSCTAADLNTALGLQQSQCAAVSASGSASTDTASATDTLSSVASSVSSNLSSAASSVASSISSVASSVTGTRTTATLASGTSTSAAGTSTTSSAAVKGLNANVFGVLLGLGAGLFAL